MPLIKDNEIVDDPWITLEDDDPLPSWASPIVSLERWRAERSTLEQRNGPLGLRLRSDQAPDEIAEDLDRFSLIALEFPKFTDGRPYSSARLLRERHGYTGELRAVGQVLRDQAIFMVRCGFDAFEVADGTPIEGWLSALAGISAWYQASSDDRTPIPALRRRRPGSNGGGESVEATPAPESTSAPVKTAASAESETVALAS